MLQHESQHESQEPAIPSASEARVTPEELNAALKALDADKQQAARREAGTVPIGAVVDELGLDATPEQIWAQVQRQRADADAQAAAQKAAADAPREALGRAARSVRESAAQAVASAQTPAAGRRRVRGWREMKGWLWVAFWCSGGLGWLTLSPLIHHNAAPAGIVVSGDSVTGSYNIQGTGPQRDVAVSGEHDAITLRGDVRNLNVDGANNTVTVIGSVEAVTVDDDGNAVHWTKEPAGKTVRPVITGDDDKVGLSGP